MAELGRLSGRARSQSIRKLLRDFMARSDPTDYKAQQTALALVAEIVARAELGEDVRAWLEANRPRPGREAPRDRGPEAGRPPPPEPRPLPANEAQAYALGLTGPCWWEEDRPPRRPAYDR